MEAIDSIKIVQVDGLTNGGRSGAANDAGAPLGGGGTGNLASDAVAAALAYRAQAPVLDGLMKELGLDGSSLGSMVKGVTEEVGGEVAEALEKVEADNDREEKAIDPPAGETAAE